MNERSASEKKRKNQSEIDYQLKFVIADLNVIQDPENMPDSVYFLMKIEVFD